MTTPTSLKIVVWLALCLIWGSTWLVIKIGLDDLPPIGFAATRFLLAVAILFVVLRMRNIRLPGTVAEWRLLAVTGVLQFSVNYSFIFWGEQHISSGLTAVLQSTMPLFGLLLAWLFLPNERVTGLKLVTVGLGVAGVAVIFGDQLRVQNTMAFVASVVVIIAAYCAAHSSVLVKSRGSALHPAVLVFGQMLCGLPPVIAYSLIVEGNPLKFSWSWKALACVLYLALVGTVAAFWLYYWLLDKVESTKAMMIAVVTPLLAVLIGWLVLNETLPTQTLLGGMLIIASIALLMFRPAAARRAATR